MSTNPVAPFLRTFLHVSDDLFHLWLQYIVKMVALKVLYKEVECGSFQWGLKNLWILAKLEKCVNYLQDKYGVQVYLEPGEAIALNAGWLVTSVLDTLKNGMDLAIVDTSAACHMPDVLEMPYRPMIIGSGESGEKAYTYRLGGPTCLAGDVIGDYSFDAPLGGGDRLAFTDMACA